MMPSRSTPNLTTQHTSTATGYSINSSAYHQERVGGGQKVTRDDDSSPPAPPVRDSSSLKSVKYGPGHEKFPSWPVPAAVELPNRTQPTGGSTRSKSWTDHTNYPKETVIPYTRPYMKRQHSQYTQQKLKTVMERCEKITPETFEPRHPTAEKIKERFYLPTVDHDGKSLGDADYHVPSPPEREFSKPQLTQADLEEYARSYQEPIKFSFDVKEGPDHRLTESGIEDFLEYNRNYEDSLFNSMSPKHGDSMLTHIHQKQVSYAQSEGYHSYVSSTDSTSTPFLDRLRRDSEAVMSRPQSSATWMDDDSSCHSRREGRDSVVTAASSGSGSSSETLKWHGSISDLSVASSSCTHLPNQPTKRQLIAHSARVQTPQKHHSESVLYMSGADSKDYAEGQQLTSQGLEEWKERESRTNNANKLKLFALNTYTVQENGGERDREKNNSKNRLSLSLQSALSVADRINELEKHQQKYSYLDPNRKHKVPDPTLKAIQKKALLSFYERHHNKENGPGSGRRSPWRSEPQLAQSQAPLSAVPQVIPKVKVTLPSRRASSASDYSQNSKRSSLASSMESKTTDHINNKIIPKHQHSNSCGSLSTDFSLGPVIMGPSISLDDWKPPDKPPERPPKNPSLRTTYPDLFHSQNSSNQGHSLGHQSPNSRLEGHSSLHNQNQGLSLGHQSPNSRLDGYSSLHKPNQDLSLNYQGHNLNNQDHNLNNQGHRSTSLGHNLNKQDHNISNQGHILNNQDHNSGNQDRRSINRDPNSNNQKQSQSSRIPSPEELPPPSPPNVLDGEVILNDEPLPPPPPECESDWKQEFNERLKKHSTSSHQKPQPQVQKPKQQQNNTYPHHHLDQVVGIPERSPRYSLIKTRTANHIIQQVSSRPLCTSSQDQESQILSHTSPRNSLTIQNGQENPSKNQVYPAQRHSLPANTSDKSNNQSTLGFQNQRGYAERSSTRYPATQKLVLNGSIAVSQKVNSVAVQQRPEPIRSIHRDEIKKHSTTPSGSVETHRAQRASIAESPSREQPPPLQPRHVRVNQSMRAKMPHDSGRARVSPPRDGVREHRSSSLSQSKASYLASRRDKDRIVTDSENGVYKRTMSPNGHAISTPEISEPQKLNNNHHRETIWPLNRSATNKETLKTNGVVRRPSFNEKSKSSSFKENEKDDRNKPNLALPDVLPVSVKIMPRSHYNHRPSHLSLSPMDSDVSSKKSLVKSPPNSPPKSPPTRTSPFSPLRTTNLSQSPFIVTSISNGTPKSVLTSTPNPKLCSTTNSTSPQTVPRASPHIKPSLSPQGSPIKLSPLRSSPPLNGFTSVSSPLQLSSVVTQNSIVSRPTPKPPLQKSESPPCNSPNKSPTLSFTYPLKTPSPRSTMSSLSPKFVDSSSQISEASLRDSVCLRESHVSQTSADACPPSPKLVEQSLQMIQRTEVVLRVNALTSDASSQTDRITPLPTRKKLQEEIECEKLSEDFVNHLPTSDRLKDLLVPNPDQKKPTDYVQGLFRVDVTLKPRPANSPFRSRNNTPSSSPPPTSTSNSIQSSGASTTTIKTSTLSLPPSKPMSTPLEPTSPLSGTSPYYTTSEPKAKFLTRYSQDMSQCHIVKDTKDLCQKKTELVERLDKKLEVLRSEALIVFEECKINDELGTNVENYITRVASAHEVAKFHLHVEEVGKITSLLLGLSGRLARAENALMSMAEDHPERRILESKRDKLQDQLEEAKKLKECIDKRSISVSNILYKYLTSEEYADYDHFINMKAKLIMDSKEINDKIKLGEEQLGALKETLIVAD